MDGQIAVARMSRSSPGMDCQAQSLLDWAPTPVPARMPALLPSHQPVGHVEFFGIDFGARFEQLDVLLNQIERVHIELGSQIIKRPQGDEAGLRMIRSTPRPRGSNVVDNRNV